MSPLDPSQPERSAVTDHNDGNVFGDQPEVLDTVQQSTDRTNGTQSTQSTQSVSQDPIRFWSWPLISSVLFPNTISEARDLAAGERNFLTGLKASLAISVAGAALLARPSSLGSEADNFDLAISYALVIIGVIIPILSLYTYVHAFDAWRERRGPVHTPRSYILTVSLAAVLIVVMNIKELIKPSGADLNSFFYPAT